MSVPSSEQQINGAQENHRITSQQFQSINPTKMADNSMIISMSCPKVANSKRQSLLILKKQHSQNVSHRRIVLYIGVLPWQKVFSKCRKHTFTSQTMVTQK